MGVYLQAWKKSKRVRRVIILSLTLSLVFLLFFSYCNRRLSPIVATLAAEKAKAAAVSAVDRALATVLEAEGEIVKTEFDTRGRLTLLTCNTAAANRIRTVASEAVNAALTDEEITKISVPIGSLFDAPLFAGRGPRLSARICPLSYATVTISDAFTSAGVNQTLFTLSCEISVEINTITPLSQSPSTLFFSCPITQIVIAGDVPQVYVGGE